MSMMFAATALIGLGVGLTALRVVWGKFKHKDAVNQVNYFYKRHADHIKKLKFHNQTIVVLDKPGDANKEVILFIHGSCARMGQWEHQIAAFADHGHRVVAYDAIGCGQSDKPDNKDMYQPSKFVDTADFIIQNVIASCPKRKAKVVIAGHSFGTYVALRVAERNLSLVSHKVLIGGTAMWQDIPGMKSKLAIFGLPNVMLWYLRPILGMSFQKLALSKKACHRLRRQEAEASSRNPVYMFAHFWRSIHQLEQPVFTDIPSLCLTGVDDQITPPGKCSSLCQMLPNATFGIVEGASHQVMQEEPAQVNEMILSFIRERREKSVSTPSH
eukprot:TRINITY_DN8008_c0_g1_i1.p1 TRINITY_DN8008_c0_g1~~TRINITY_DN8008_c0_g1_i1.p1  ORF type:complete len:328 (+),score=39.62 TRINITY_DN8008_c0_g1_i1:41-1024(+)